MHQYYIGIGQNQHIGETHYSDQYYTDIDIGTGIGNIGNIGILVKVSLANQFHKCMYLLFYKCHNSKLKFSM